MAAVEVVTVRESWLRSAAYTPPTAWSLTRRSWIEGAEKRLDADLRRSLSTIACTWAERCQTFRGNQTSISTTQRRHKQLAIPNILPRWTRFLPSPCLAAFDDNLETSSTVYDPTESSGKAQRRPAAGNEVPEPTSAEPNANRKRDRTDHGGGLWDDPTMRYWVDFTSEGRIRSVKGKKKKKPQWASFDDGNRDGAKENEQQDGNDGNDGDHDPGSQGPPSAGGGGGQGDDEKNNSDDKPKSDNDANDGAPNRKDEDEKKAQDSDGKKEAVEQDAFSNTQLGGGPSLEVVPDPRPEPSISTTFGAWTSRLAMGGGWGFPGIKKAEKDESTALSIRDRKKKVADPKSDDAKTGLSAGVGVVKPDAVGSSLRSTPGVEKANAAEDEPHMRLDTLPESNKDTHSDWDPWDNTTNKTNKKWKSDKPPLASASVVEPQSDVKTDFWGSLSTSKEKIKGGDILEREKTAETSDTPTDELLNGILHTDKDMTKLVALNKPSEIRHFVPMSKNKGGKGSKKAQSETVDKIRAPGEVSVHPDATPEVHNKSKLGMDVFAAHPPPPAPTPPTELTWPQDDAESPVGEHSDQDTEGAKKKAEEENMLQVEAQENMELNQLKAKKAARKGKLLKKDQAKLDRLMAVVRVREEAKALREAEEQAHLDEEGETNEQETKVDEKAPEQVDFEAATQGIQADEILQKEDEEEHGGMSAETASAHKAHKEKKEFEALMAKKASTKRGKVSRNDRERFDQLSKSITLCEDEAAADETEIMAQEAKAMAEEDTEEQTERDAETTKKATEIAVEEKAQGEGEEQEMAKLEAKKAKKAKKGRLSIKENIRLGLLIKGCERRAVDEAKECSEAVLTPAVDPQPGLVESDPADHEPADDISAPPRTKEVKKEKKSMVGSNPETVSESLKGEGPVLESGLAPPKTADAGLEKTDKTDDDPTDWDMPKKKVRKKEDKAADSKPASERKLERKPNLPKPAEHEPEPESEPVQAPEPSYVMEYHSRATTISEIDRKKSEKVDKLDKPVPIEPQPQRQAVGSNGPDLDHDLGLADPTISQVDELLRDEKGRMDSSADVFAFWGASKNSKPKIPVSVSKGKDADSSRPAEATPLVNVEASTHLTEIWEDGSPSTNAKSRKTKAVGGRIAGRLQAFESSNVAVAQRSERPVPSEETKNQVVVDGNADGNVDGLDERNESCPSLLAAPAGSATASAPTTTRSDLPGSFPPDDDNMDELLQAETAPRASVMTWTHDEVADDTPMSMPPPPPPPPLVPEIIQISSSKKERPKISREGSSWGMWNAIPAKEARKSRVKPEKKMTAVDKEEKTSSKESTSTKVEKARSKEKPRFTSVFASTPPLSRSFSTRDRKNTTGKPGTRRHSVDMSGPVSLPAEELSGKAAKVLGLNQWRGRKSLDEGDAFMTGAAGGMPLPDAGRRKAKARRLSTPALDRESIAPEQAAPVRDHAVKVDPVVARPHLKRSNSSAKRSTGLSSLFGGILTPKTDARRRKHEDESEARHYGVKEARRTERVRIPAEHQANQEREAVRRQRRREREELEADGVGRGDQGRRVSRRGEERDGGEKGRRRESRRAGRGTGSGEKEHGPSRHKPGADDVHVQRSREREDKNSWPHSGTSSWVKDHSDAPPPPPVATVVDGDPEPTAVAEGTARREARRARRRARQADADMAGEDVDEERRRRRRREDRERERERDSRKQGNDGSDGRRGESRRNQIYIETNPRSSWWKKLTRM